MKTVDNEDQGSPLWAVALALLIWSLILGFYWAIS